MSEKSDAKGRYFRPKSRLWRMFTINISLVVTLFLVGIFIGFVLKADEIIRQQYLTIARAHFKSIVLARRWNANYGGVFVKKVRGVVSNPFLEKPDITTSDGVVYTMKNPALMTREISEYARHAGDYQYHITSLKPLNPANEADTFENMALRQFEKGLEETSQVLLEDGRSTFRYMAPLRVEAACLACHGFQGYTRGDVRGGISVSFDITAIETKISKNRRILTGLSILLSLLLLGIIYLMVARLARRLSSAYRTIEKMSITDELTGLYNRRFFHRRMREEINRAIRHKGQIGVVIMDIDHFKTVNDTYGHPAGDLVLKKVAALARTSIRKHDLLARYGGEEFAIVLPETSCSKAVLVAEKIRVAIENEPFNPGGNETIRITASFGVASMDQLPEAEREKALQIIQLADRALYYAKKLGRNQTATLSDNEHG